MRIVVHGQEAFGKAVWRSCWSARRTSSRCAARPTRRAGPKIRSSCSRSRKGLPVHQPKSWKTPEALELMKSFNADVCMMAYVLLFVPQPVLDAPKLGTFQYHPSLLPAHRGPSSINWPIAMGKTQHRPHDLLAERRPR